MVATASSIADGLSLLIVGETPMQFRGYYHPDQLWFDFMAGTILHQPSEETCYTPRTQKDCRAIVLASAKAHARVPPEARIIYSYRQGVPQWGLPFKEFQRVSRAHESILKAEEWPGWARHDGALLRLAIRRDERNVTADWLIDNCRGRYSVQPGGSERGFVIFERECDYVHAKLRFA